MARGRGYAQNAQRRPSPAQAGLRGRGRNTARNGRGRGRRSRPSPLPFDSQAARESAELGNEGADVRAGLAAKFAAASNELGFGTGSANPYGESQENKRGYEANRRGILNTAGNQLYAGSTVNAQSNARAAYDRAQKAIEDRYAQAQGDYTGGVAETGRQEGLGELGIKEGAIKRAEASEPAPLAAGNRRRRGRGRVAAGSGLKQRSRGRGRV